jgi:hypothetical protein
VEKTGFCLRKSVRHYFLPSSNKGMLYLPLASGRSEMEARMEWQGQEMWGGGFTGENQRDGGGRVARQGLINDENVLYGFFYSVFLSK